MAFPERFSNLPDSMWPRLRALLDPVPAGAEPLAMTIGEPKHAIPPWVGEVIAENLNDFGRYPTNPGNDALLEAITGWVKRRYGVTVPEDRVLALSGTREGLYNAAHALCPEQKNGAQPIVAIPNPFYQVYSAAAASIHAEPLYLNATAETGHLPDLDALDPATLDRVAIFYLCSPANPQGSVASNGYWRQLLTLAERDDFIVFAHECYAEIYRHGRPPGVLQVAGEMGADPERVVAFHSLSKRSNLAGLRSGFAVAGPESMKRMRMLRNYAGAPLPEPLQAVATRTWSDDAHVALNRELYAEKFNVADAIFADVPGYASPEAGFFLWLPVPDGEEATVKLWRETGVRVLPGAYLAQTTDAGNPGAPYIRAALVAPKADVQRGLTAIRDCLYS